MMEGRGKRRLVPQEAELILEQLDLVPRNMEDGV